MRKLKFTRRKNGQMMTTMRFEFHLSQEQIADLERYAMDQDFKDVRSYILDRAQSGIWEDVLDCDYEFSDEKPEKGGWRRGQNG